MAKDLGPRVRLANGRGDDAGLRRIDRGADVVRLSHGMAIAIYVAKYLKAPGSPIVFADLTTTRRIIHGRSRPPEAHDPTAARNAVVLI